MNSKVDEYIEIQEKWQKELRLLRNIILDCGLKEEYKWMHPCYTHKQKNIVLIHEFKDYCAILFNKGVLLKDAENILVQQTENVQAARQLRYTDILEIEKSKTIIQAYIYEAIEIEKAGLKVKMKKTADFNVPDELEDIFNKDDNFKAAFNNLTPGRQKGYLLHFSQATQSKTRISRIEKATSRILIGKGLNDCICGLSKRYPNCDGSHKNISQAG
jgi:uncharacterized protein YdeI (YjbR/CyaY-like superfamily)